MDDNKSFTTVCLENQCCGCNLCANICPVKAISINDSIVHLNAVISNSCIHCHRCIDVCPQNNPVSKLKPKSWYQGWAQSDIRKIGSSGGIATAISKYFLSSGGLIATCQFIDGEYRYIIIRNEEQLVRSAGSKYAKSNPGNIYLKVKSELSNGNKVLFIGLPCHVAAIKKFIGSSFENNLYTIDLICHGSPSFKLFKSAMESYGYDLNNIKLIKFRNNSHYEISVDQKLLVLDGIMDKYTMGFIDGVFFTENCYSCQYAGISRVSDITLGDSWGTDLIDEKEKGISLVLCQSLKGESLLNNSNLTLHHVDLKKAIESNLQLNRPVSITRSRNSFFTSFFRFHNFRIAMYIAKPKKCFRQSIKGFLSFVHLGALNKLFSKSHR